MKRLSALRILKMNSYDKLIWAVVKVFAFTTAQKNFYDKLFICR